MNLTWDLSHRPTTVDEICTYPELKDNLRLFESEKSFPNLILHGHTGTGKTTIARLLSNLTGWDTEEINCNTIRDIKTISRIAKAPNSLFFMADGTLDLKILDEFHLWKPEQQLLFSKVMEDYADKIRYIICANDFNKIADPIKSRCRIFNTDVCILDSKNRLEVYPHTGITLKEWKTILRNRAIHVADKECAKGTLKPYSTDTIDMLLEKDHYCLDIRTFIRAVGEQFKLDQMKN